MFALGWVELFPSDAPIEVGTTVGILVRHFGFWSLNAARIVYLINEQDSLEMFGFGYGTISGHAERGEERFTVEYHHSDDAVWYDLCAFSQPKHFLAKLDIQSAGSCRNDSPEIRSKPCLTPFAHNGPATRRARPLIIVSRLSAGQRCADAR